MALIRRSFGKTHRMTFAYRKDATKYAQEQKQLGKKVAISKREIPQETINQWRADGWRPWFEGKKIYEYIICTSSQF